MEREAGPALDADIGQHIMGLIVQRWRVGDVVTGSVYLVGKGLFTTPAYSTTYEGMGLVIERMRALWWALHVRPKDGGHMVTFTREGLCGAWWAEQLPHAVALAALAAMGGRDG